MNSLLEARMEHLEDLKKEHLEDLKETVQHLPRCDFANLQRMASTGVPLLARIAWCRRQRRQAPTQREVDGWRAEEEGLRDALLKRDRTYQYRYSPSILFERYAMGLEDGRSLIRLGWVDCMWHPAANGTQV